MRRTASVLRRTGEPGLSRAAAGNEALADHIEAIEKEVLLLRERFRDLEKIADCRLKNVEMLEQGFGITRDETYMQAIKRWEAIKEEVLLLRSALTRIEKGRGPHSRDKYEHACNVIERSKEIARAALKGEEFDA